jgi:phage shock protein PspC (stress-responsive transcriptional regulator)
MNQGTKLTRSRDDRVIAGVAGGIAEYLGWSSTMLRFLFIVTGAGVGVYIVLMILMPEPPELMPKIKLKDLK